MGSLFATADSFDQLVRQIPADMLAIFARSLRVGCWPDGTTMTDKQRVTCEQTLWLRGIALYRNESS